MCCEHFLPLYSEHGYCYAFNPRYIDTADAELVLEYTKSVDNLFNINNNKHFAHI